MMVADSIMKIPSLKFDEQSAVLPWVLYASIAVAAYCVYEQVAFYSYRWKSSGKLIPGPKYAVPLLGGLLKMVANPHQFWRDQAHFSWKGMSWNSMIGKYMLFTTDVDLSRKILNQNDKDTLLMVVHPSGKNILGESNLAFMHGPAHKAIRKSFLSLFTRKALSTYVELQDDIIRRTIRQWLENTNEREISNEIRRMNLLTSQEVFVGPYMDDPVEREKFCSAFMDMTAGFLAIPILFPGTAVWKGRKGRLYVISVLEKAAGRSRAAMKAGKEPKCLMDYWAQRCLEEIDIAEAEGTQPYNHTTEHGMAETVMDFLFASQDASTASLVWLMALMADHPEILEKVRQEQAEVRPDLTESITGEVLYKMTFARQVVKEVLRYRAPAPMVPMLAQKAFPLTDDYTVPKGTLVMPSLHTACLEGFSDPLKFDPDRFSPERQEDVKHAKNFMPFGHGPHYCVGKEYAINHLTAFLAILATSCNWTRRITENSRDDFSNWQYLPTIYPADTLITLSKRAEF